MAISLQKGQKIDLTKTNPGLTKVFVGLGWDTNKYLGGEAFDLDVAAFLLGVNNKVATENDFIFYNNTTNTNKSIKHKGDNKDGNGDGDDEVITIDLLKVPASIAHIQFTVTIHEAESRRQYFGQVSNAYIRVINEDNNNELIKYDLGEDFSIETAIVVADLYRNGDEWKFNAIGSGFSGGLASLCKNFGLEV